jgi:signal transduction histidine kinase
MTLHKRPFKLKDLEDKCSLRNLAERKGLNLIWNTPDSLGEVYGDPERIAQVLTNLVNNAIKFTDHGSVTINAFEKDKNHIQVDVIDTGPGIPKKEQELIFERFQRSSVSKINNKEGSGLGLAIAKEIMKLHDSDITVKSEVGKGSTFSIVLRKAPKNKEEKDEIDKYLEKIGEEEKNEEKKNEEMKNSEMTKIERSNEKN